MTKERIAWIDIAKGLGIILVVFGHSLSPHTNIQRYIFWFHMPLFFFISGYLYRPREDGAEYFRKKFHHLLVPYFTFLILFSITDYISVFMNDVPIKNIIIMTITKIYGGRYLGGKFAIFWFITCLFITQQLYNFIYNQLKTHKILILVAVTFCYFLALINSHFFKNIYFPLSINAVAISLPFYYIGHLYSLHPYLMKWKKLIVVISIIFICLAFYIDITYAPIVFRMKRTVYALPILSFIFSLTFIGLIIYASKLTCSIASLKVFFSNIGKASMTIMFLHLPIKYFFQKQLSITNWLLFTVLGIILPFLFHQIINRFHTTSLLLLGVRHVGKR